MENSVNKYAEQLMAGNQQMMTSALRLAQLTVEAETEILRHGISSMESLPKVDVTELWGDIKTPADFISKSTEITTQVSQGAAEWMQRSMTVQTDIATRMSRAYQDEMTKTANAFLGTSVEA